ncbi:hypothetical protein PJ985_20195 [Streptomyces sp. ACA25]|uniref:hypothetical protein n=1 Tax=Streptomyces sp. ACA25 TaxID=3022596 RepID=UPI00230808EA|nr:hypothetical protein [Streptomyces sp. ACA25]MDB1089882.1 hypothetical protein [Streptomyces sp. ACA25]
MGWTVLYIAFGLVALWLLGEVLLQYKARLRWRLTAFFGFLTVVFGVLLPSVYVIALGTIAFAVGQTCVTLSFRRGFSTGWALGGSPGTSRRRRDVQPMEPLDHDPDADVYGVPAEHDEHGGHAGPDGDLRDDGRPSYDAYATPDAGFERPDESWAPQDVYAPLEDYARTAYVPQAGDSREREVYAGGPSPARSDAYAAPAAPYADPYQQQEQYAAYAQDAAPQTQPFAAYSDPYIGGAGSRPVSYPDYGGPAYPQDAPAHQPYAPAQDPADGGPWSGAQPSYQETPPGGVWMPQQRDPAAPDPMTGYPQDGPHGQQPDGSYPQPGAYDGGQGYYYNEPRY